MRPRHGANRMTGPARPTAATGGMVASPQDRPGVVIADARPAMPPAPPPNTRSGGSIATLPATRHSANRVGWEPRRRTIAYPGPATPAMTLIRQPTTDRGQAERQSTCTRLWTALEEDSLRSQPRITGRSVRRLRRRTRSQEKHKIGDRRGITTAGQVALMTLGYRKVVVRIRKSAGLGYPCRVGSPIRGFGEPHRNPTTQRHGGRSPQESHGRNGTLRYTCYAC